MYVVRTYVSMRACVDAAAQNVLGPGRGQANRAQNLRAFTQELEFPSSCENKDC